MRQKIVIAVGGTGGHVLPALRVGKKLSRQFDVVYLGVGLSRNRFFNQEWVHYDIEGGGITSFKKNFMGILQARKWLKRIQPQFVVGFGSFHSFPVLAASAYLGIPYYLFELNVVPGRVNRLFSRGAKKTFIHFHPRVKRLSGRLQKVDYRFEEVDEISQRDALKYFGLSETKKTLLIFGGSQGAEAINRLMREGAVQLKEFQVLHFTGGDISVKAEYDALGIQSHVEPFCHCMHIAWTAADLAICRSGAGAMREILIYERPALLIPYPTAKDDHQLHNALYMEKDVGGAICLEQKGLTPELFVQAIFAGVKKIDSMKQSIQRFKEREKLSSFVGELCGSIIS